MRSVFFAALIFVCLAALPPFPAAAPENPHAFGSGDCRGCHLTDPERTRTEGQGKLRMVAPVKQLCARCHWQVTETYSHPVEIYPVDVEVPPDLPLSWNGRMTCSSCHDIHGKPSSAAGKRTFFLRRPTRGKAFCVACHKENPVTRISARRKTHKGAIAYAHTAKYIVQKPGIGIDSMSIECLSCHDGSQATAISPQVGAGTWSHAQGGGPHPIGVNYGLARARKGDLVPEAMLPRSIKLFGGTVGCGSCHDPYSPRSRKLVTERKGLCNSCHLK